MATRSNSNEISIGGYVPLIDINPINTSAYANAAQQAKQQEIQSRADQAAGLDILTNLKFNAKDEPFRQQLIDEVNHELSAYAMDGPDKAVMQAQLLAKKMASRADVIGRVQNNAAWETKMKEKEAMFQQGLITKDTLDAYKIANQYEFNGITDENGNVTGYDPWQEKHTITQDMDIDQELYNLYKTISPEQYSTSTDGSHTKSDRSGSSHHSSKSYQRVKEENIWDVLTENVLSNDRLKDAIDQRYWTYNTLLSDVNKKLLTETDPTRRADLEMNRDRYEEATTNYNGIRSTGKNRYTDYLKKYFAKHVKNWAYDHITEASGGTRVDKPDTSLAGGGGGANGSGGGNDTPFYGPNINKTGLVTTEGMNSNGTFNWGYWDELRASATEAADNAGSK